MWHRVAGWFLCATSLAAGLTGCQDRATPRPPAGAAVAGSSPARPTFDETKGYLHKPSGVGFVYPCGWENLGVTDRGPITSLGLRKREPPMEVTLYWTRLDVPIDPTNVGHVEYEALRSVYGDKVGKPESMRNGEQPGYRLAISGGPLGEDSPALSGVVYVFAVSRESQPWKIKLRATAKGREHLSLAEELLQNYRW